MRPVGTTTKGGDRGVGSKPASISQPSGALAAPAVLAVPAPLAAAKPTPTPTPPPTPPPRGATPPQPPRRALSATRLYGVMVEPSSFFSLSQRHGDPEDVVDIDTALDRARGGSPTIAAQVKRTSCRFSEVLPLPQLAVDSDAEAAEVVRHGPPHSPPASPPAEGSVEAGGSIKGEP